MQLLLWPHMSVFVSVRARLCVVRQCVCVCAVPMSLSHLLQVGTALAVWDRAFSDFKHTATLCVCVSSASAFILPLHRCVNASDCEASQLRSGHTRG